MLDGKGLAVLHATALIALARAGARLERDVILLATPDGLLGGGAGLRAALKAHPELARAELVLTKGGGSLDDFLSDGRVIHAIATGEKGFARLAVTALARRAESARGEPVASRRLAAALTAVLDAPVVVRLTPSTLALLEHAAAGAPFPDRWLYGSAVLARTFVIGGLARNETTRSLVTEPVRVVSLRGGAGDGATVPRRASAELWASLLPGTTPGEMSSRVRVEILDSDVHVAIEAGAAASESGIHAALFELVKAQLAAPDSNEPIVPYLSPEPSDGRHLRAVGVPVYGVVPLRFSAADLNSIRGPDEHVAITQLRAGIRAMTEIVGALAASNGSRPEPYSSK